jgi:hypothetical protein
MSNYHSRRECFSFSLKQLLICNAYCVLAYLSIKASNNKQKKGKILEKPVKKVSYQWNFDFFTSSRHRDKKCFFVAPSSLNVMMDINAFLCVRTHCYLFTINLSFHIIFRRKSISGNWKTNQGSAMLEKTEMTEKYKTWIDEVCQIYWRWICSIKFICVCCFILFVKFAKFHRKQIIYECGKRQFYMENL